MKTKKFVEGDMITLTKEDVAIVFEGDDSIVLYLTKSANDEASSQLVLASIIAYACVTTNPIVNVAMKMVVDEYTKDIEEQRKK